MYIGRSKERTRRMGVCQRVRIKAVNSAGKGLASYYKSDTALPLYFPSIRKLLQKGRSAVSKSLPFTRTGNDFDFGEIYVRKCNLSYECIEKVCEEIRVL